MSYYDDNDYLRASPELIPFRPDLGGCPPLSFPPSWLFQEICETPPNTVQIELDGDGLEARQKLHRLYRIHHQQAERRFMDTVLLHQMAPSDPRLAFSLGSCDILRNNGSDESLAEDGNWPDSDSTTIGKASLWRTQDPPLSSLPSHEIRSKLRTSTTPSLSKIGSSWRSRLGLPITLHRQGISATVLSCANADADVNIISEEVARKLGLSRADEVSDRKEFALADGTTVKALGRVELACSFGTEAESFKTMTCMFYVVRKNLTPIMMGLSFLEEMGTMSGHREALVRVPTSVLQALSVHSMDKSKQLLVCELNHVKTLATPGFGSEVDMISPSFASYCGLYVHPTDETIELADGSMVITSGFVRVKLSIASISASDLGFHPMSKITVEFRLVKWLRHDLIVSQDSLDELNVFTKHQDALVPAPSDCIYLGLNRKRDRKSKECKASGIKQDIKAARSGNWIDGDMGRSSRSSSMDRRENNRREDEVTAIRRLPRYARQAAIVAEAIKQDAYAYDPYASSRPGPLACKHPGCDAEPMWTQQLLDSHMKSHYLRRLHYCPVSSCSRSEGGEGFKRKVEMIRHGIVHQSLAYVCPFCPAGYLQPNSLAQHVRVDHVDVTSNNSELLAALAHRSERGSRRHDRKTAGLRH